MFIVYRRTGGILALIGIAIAAIAAIVLTVAVGTVVLIGTLAAGAVLFLLRAVLPTSRRRRQAPPPSHWPGETIDASVVESTVLPDGTDTADTRRRQA